MIGIIGAMKEEVDAIEQALYCEGLGFDDEKVEKSEQVARTEPVMQVPLDRVTIAQSSEELRQFKAKEVSLASNKEETLVQATGDPTD